MPIIAKFGNNNLRFLRYKLMPSDIDLVIEKYLIIKLMVNVFKFKLSK